MEFWGVEVKPGEVLNSDLGNKYVHLSQAALGEVQNPKGNERVPLYVHVNGKKLVIGTLAFGKCDQLSLDLVFDGEFGLSHGFAAGSVFFSGYTSVPEDKDDGMEMGGDDSDSDSEDERQAKAFIRRVKENATGKAAPKIKSEDAKLVSDQRPGEDEESSDDDDNENEEDSGDSDSEDKSDEDENQKTPMVETASKKRPLSKSATKSQPTADKKAKTIVPVEAQKSGTDGGKDGPRTPARSSVTGSKDQKGQTPKAKDTPVPKEASKTPVTPGTGSAKKIGAHNCATCSRNFATESALSQHNAAKHGGKQG